MPLSTQRPSERGSARVRIEAKSDPASDSVSAKDVRALPEVSSGRYLRFCTSVPWRWIAMGASPPLDDISSENMVCARLISSCTMQ